MGMKASGREAGVVAWREGETQATLFVLQVLRVLILDLLEKKRILEYVQVFEWVSPY